MSVKKYIPSKELSPHELETNFSAHLGLFTRLNIFTNEITFNNFVMEGIDHDRLEQYLQKVQESLDMGNVPKSTLVETIVNLLSASLIAYSDFKVR